jgi:group II intron reverse transcriptase/maturase
MMAANGKAPGAGGAKAASVETELREGNMPLSIDKGSSMSPGLSKVAKRAKRDPNARFHSLAHYLDEGTLKRAFDRIRRDAAVGVDGITKDEYGQHLEERIRELHDRLKTKRYRHQPILRVHIPKAPGKTRPIGISAIEDKIVQGALREVLETVYEQDFLPCSYGFRPGRRAHDALRTLDQMAFREGITVILEADIHAYFDSLDRKRLSEMLQIRIADPSLLRLIGKCLHVGVLDGEEFSTPEVGTAQGSILSPMLGNVYLHYLLDVWFEQAVKPRLAGRSRLIRYADDFVIGFEREDDAIKVLELLNRRMAEYGLTLHPDKTRLVHFERARKGKDLDGRTETFDFLGFTIFWSRSRGGSWILGMKTRKARLQRALKALGDWCRRHRHLPLKEQHAALSRRLRGHYQYFGVNGNIRSLQKLLHRARRAWHKWLERRGQRGRLPWKRFDAYLKAFPLPSPKICVQIWVRSL